MLERRGCRVGLRGEALSHCLWQLNGTTKKGDGWIKHQSASAVAKRLERRCGWGGVCGGGVITSIWAIIRMAKIKQNGPHNNQPKTSVHDERYDGEGVQPGGSV